MLYYDALFDSMLFAFTCSIQNMIETKAQNKCIVYRQQLTLTTISCSTLYIITIANDMICIKFGASANQDCNSTYNVVHKCDLL